MNAIYQTDYFADEDLYEEKLVQQKRLKTVSYELNVASIRKFDADKRKLVEYDRDDVEKKQRLGSGEFGIVYAGILKRSISVAIKEARPNKQSTEIEQDASKLAHIDHKNVIKILGICYYKEEHAPWIIMELGEISLRRFLDELDFEMSMEYKFDCLNQICQAMRFLNSNGVDNRDLKADNIVMSFRPMGPSEFKNVVYKLIDISSKAGTVTHMPPEAFNGKYSHSKSDVWSFGVLCWEVLTGLKPYSQFKNRNKLMVEIYYGTAKLSLENIHPNKMVDLLIRCWAFNIDDRPSFDDIYIELEAIQKEFQRLDSTFKYNSLQTPNISLFNYVNDSDCESNSTEIEEDIDVTTIEIENNYKIDQTKSIYKIPDNSFFSN